MTGLFIDTDVVVDLLTDRKPFSGIAARLFDHSEKGNARLYLSSLSYANIYYVVRKNTTHKTMIGLLRDLESITETVDVTKAIIKASLQSEFKDFEDAIQYQAAVSNKKISAIVTRNPKDYKGSALAVLSPEEAVGLLDSATQPE